MQNQSELIVITRSKNIISYIFSVSDNAPKKFRFSLLSKMQNLSLDILEALILANEQMLSSKENCCKRRELQQKALAGLRVLDSVALIAREQKCLLPKQYEFLSKSIDECTRLTAAWINSDKRRLESMGIRL